MNYQKIYEDFISDRRSKPAPEGYTERHHIVPAHMGGTNKSENIIRLSAYDHYFSHLIYAKWKNTSKAWYSVKAMMDIPGSSKKRLSSKMDGAMYAYARENANKASSEIVKALHKTDWVKCLQGKEVRKKQSNSMKKYFAGMTKHKRDELNAHRIDCMNTPEGIQNRINGVKRFWKTEEGNNFKEKRSKAWKENNPMNDLAIRAITAAASKEYHNIPEVKARKSAWMKENNPMKRKEVRGKVSAALIGKYTGKNSAVAKSVTCIETGITYVTQTEAAKMTGALSSKICCVCKGKAKTAGGYHWKFA